MEALIELNRIMKIQDPEARDLAFRWWKDNYLVQFSVSRVLTKEEVESAYFKDHKECSMAKELGLNCVQECGTFSSTLMRGNRNFPASLQLRFHTQTRLDLLALRARKKPSSSGGSS